MMREHHPNILSAKKQILESLQEIAATFTDARGPEPGRVGILDQAVKRIAALRGRALYYPFVGTGRGRGPLVELLDGSVKYDFITGIGINFFGHSHPVLQSAVLDAGCSDVVMEGNLAPNADYLELLELLLGSVHGTTALAHSWIINSGTMANEIAIKIIRQKKSPAFKMVSFAGGFAGRSTMMQEMTDNPKYREGQPWHDEVFHIPYYNSADPSPLQTTLNSLKKVCSENQIAGVWMELIQGEGGFIAPTHDYVQNLMKEIKALDLGIWVDEVQTFGRTGELFAFQTYEVEKYVDVVTVGKLLQVCACLWTPEYNPKPGLIAGTFMGSVAAIRSGIGVLQELKKPGVLGKNGHINQLGKLAEKTLREMGDRLGGLVHNITAVGGMVAFQIGDGNPTTLNEFLQKLFQEGVMAFNCGRGPYRVRLLLPSMGMDQTDLLKGFAIIEKALGEFAAQKGLLKKDL